MDIRLFILSLACMSCIVPNHGSVLTAKLLAKKAIGAGAAFIAGEAALIKEGIANKISPDCGPEGSAVPNKVLSIIDTKKKLISDIIGLKEKIFGDVIEKKNQLIEGLLQPEKVVVLHDAPPAPFFVEGAAPLVDFPHVVEFPSFPPHPVVDLPQFPPKYVDYVVDVPPKHPQRLYPGHLSPSFLHGEAIYPVEPIPIRHDGGDC